MDDPLRMYLIVRRGAFDTIDEGGRLAGIAAVNALEQFEIDPEWLRRPGKVVLRARSPSQWQQILEFPHASAGDGVIALPPQRPSERPEILDRIQAMSTELEPPPETADGPLLYGLNVSTMSSGKTLAQIAHAAVMAHDLGLDVQGARVVAGHPPGYRCVAEVQDAGLTEVPPGTKTVRVLVRQRDA